MGAYMCIKPAKYAGVNYSPGEIIPEEAIPAGRVNAVKRLGLIADAPEPAPEPTDPVEVNITIPIQMEDGSVFPLDVTGATIQEAVTVLQMSAEEAIKHIAEMTNDAALVVIDACESRKTVKKAAVERAAAIDAAEGRHIGIQNVRERLEKQCGGTLTLLSRPGAGTTVTVFVPGAGQDEQGGDT